MIESSIGRVTVHRADGRNMRSSAPGDEPMKGPETMKIIRSIILASLVLSVSISFAFAKVGVGVGLGKIQIDEELSPGGIYNLPSLPVLNTGDEDGEYEVEVTYLTEQQEMRPSGEWFSFSPQSFFLAAGESQLVDISLTLPVDTRPGDYFAFLEAHPVVEGEGVSIGVAAATKLKFSVAPKGVLGAAAERIRSLVEANRQVAYALGAIVVLLTVYSLGKRYLNVNVGLKKPKKPKVQSSSKEEKEKEDEA